MIPCVSLTETSVLGNMKERVKEMRVFGCRLNFWALTPKLAATKGIKRRRKGKVSHKVLTLISFADFFGESLVSMVNSDENPGIKGLWSDGQPN